MPLPPSPSTPHTQNPRLCLTFFKPPRYLSDPFFIHTQSHPLVWATRISPDHCPGRPVAALSDCRPWSSQEDLFKPHVGQMRVLFAGLKSQNPCYSKNKLTRAFRKNLTQCSSKNKRPPQAQVKWNWLYENLIYKMDLH